MTRLQVASQARRELDRRLSDQNLRKLSVRPHRGWIRAIREALGMTQADLALRLGVTASAIAQLEIAEVHGGITLSKLAEVAGAMDSEVVYAFVPNRSLQDTVMTQARRVAQDRLNYVSGTMALEDQSVPDRIRAEHLDRLAKEIVADGTLWRDTPSRKRPNRHPL
jgi:predicted DNA-binding mobile mystery protein A